LWILPLLENIKGNRHCLIVHHAHVDTKLKGKLSFLKGLKSKEK